MIYYLLYSKQLYQTDRRLNQKSAKKKPKIETKNVLELGAGCGLLGLVLAHFGYKVVLTEHPDVLPNLEQNVERNVQQNKDISAIALPLRWGEEKDMKAIENLDICPFDMIVGTDVVYQVEYVEPLLVTMDTLSHEHTQIWLCIQERCAVAYKKLLELAPIYFIVEHISVQDLPKGFEYAEELECKVFKFTKKDPSAVSQ